MIVVGSRVRRLARALATVAIGGLIAMHAMDAGSAHAAMMPESASASTSQHAMTGMDAAPAPHAEPAAHTGPGHTLDLPAHSMSHSCAVVCVLAPVPAHALPEPADVTAARAGAAASVVFFCAARAPDPPSLVALGVCRR